MEVETAVNAAVRALSFFYRTRVDQPQLPILKVGGLGFRQLVGIAD
jgi:hypothetical protein